MVLVFLQLCFCTINPIKRKEQCLYVPLPVNMQEKMMQGLDHLRAICAMCAKSVSNHHFPAACCATVAVAPPLKTLSGSKVLPNRTQYAIKRALDAWKYGSGADFKL